jgi:hypothetical protein
MKNSGGGANEQQRDESAGRSMEVEEARLAWGNPTSWKARWRDESLQRHLQLPLGARLRAALSLVRRRSADRERQSP